MTGVGAADPFSFAKHDGTNMPRHASDPFQRLNQRNTSRPAQTGRPTEVAKARLLDIGDALETLETQTCISLETRASAASLRSVAPHLNLALAGEPADHAAVNKVTQPATQLTIAPSSVASEAVLNATTTSPAELGSLDIFDVEGRLASHAELEHETAFIGNAPGSATRRQQPVGRRALVRHRLEAALSFSPSTARGAPRVWATGQALCDLDPMQRKPLQHHIDSALIDGGISRRSALGNWGLSAQRSTVRDALPALFHALRATSRTLMCAVANTATAQIVRGKVTHAFVKGSSFQAQIGTSMLAVSMADIEDVYVTTLIAPDGPIQAVEAYDWRYHLAVWLSTGDAFTDDLSVAL
ncbi:MAG: hypothetical protein AAGG72_07935 [Pseudomonadota bacterium]